MIMKFLNSKITTVVLSVLIVVAVIVGIVGYSGVTKPQAGGSLGDLISQNEAFPGALADLDKTAELLKAEVVALEGAVKAKKTFDASVAAAKKGIAGAKGKADGTADAIAKKIASSSKEVAAAKTAADVEKHTKVIDSDVAGLMKEIKAFDNKAAAEAEAAAQAERDRVQQEETVVAQQMVAQSSGGGASSGGGGGNAPVAQAPAPAPVGKDLNYYRGILDAVGGGGVPLVWRPGADAATGSDGTIYVGEAANSWDPYLVMRHELAHVYQFRVGYYAIMASPAFNAAFGGNIEQLANCMATQMGTNSGEYCGGARAGIASAVLAGRVP